MKVLVKAGDLCTKQNIVLLLRKLNIEEDAFERIASGHFCFDLPLSGVKFDFRF